MSKRAVMALVALLLLSASGCGPGASGIDSPPRPQIPTDVPQATATASHPPRPVRPASVIAGPPGTATAALRPCDLLTEAERQKLGVVILDEKVLGFARSCGTRASGKYALAIAIFDTMRMQDVVAQGEKKPILLAGRPAVQMRTTLDGCGISLQVSEMSRVDVLVSANGDHERACSVAHQAAVMVEAKLP